MTCEEARQLMETVWDLPPNDIRRKRLEQHVESCASCAIDYDLWVDSLDMLHSLQHEPSEAEGEAVNRNVMSRIYLDFPWLVEENEKHRPSGRVFRKRVLAWIAGFAALFGSSSLYMAFRGSTEEVPQEAQVTGILPTGVAGGEAPIGSQQYNIPGTNSGIIEPMVAGMDPSQPQYWMVLSVLGVGLALLFLVRLNRLSRR